MPRDIGTGLYHYPEGTPGNPAQTIFSTRYNTFINDLANTMNQKLPLNMGGTGADNTTDARANLDAEVRGVQVTNYDTHVFEAGSFWSAIGATGAPNPGARFVGICIIIEDGTNDIFIYVTPPGSAGPVTYNRRKNAGVWGAWAVMPGALADLDAIYVNVAGDTMTGNLNLVYADPTIQLNKAGAANVSQIYVMLNSVPQWLWRLSDATLGDFNLYRFNDAGALLDIPLAISRASGIIQFAGDVTIAKSTPKLIIKSSLDTEACEISLVKGPKQVWGIRTSAAAVGDFSIRSFDDAGAMQGINPFSINRASGYVHLGSVEASTSTSTGALRVNGGVGIVGTVNVGGSVVARGALGGIYNLDASMNYITVANTALIAIISNFSGIVIVNSFASGICEAFICGGGPVTRFASASGTTLIGATSAPPQNGYAFYNNTGSTSDFGVMALRTRPGY